MFITIASLSISGIYTTVFNIKASLFLALSASIAYALKASILLFS